MLKPTEYSPATREFVRPPRYLAIDSTANYALWAALHPFKSWLGFRAMRREATQPVPDCWAGEFAGRRVLVMGTGPSLDRATPEFLASFDTVIHINFALRRPVPDTHRYFFTTDLVAIVPMIETFGPDPLREVGRDRCILAPVFFDQFPMLTGRGRELFTVLRADAAEWRRHWVRKGGLKLPISLRYHPRQPDWTAFALPDPGMTLPVLDHTSALSAVIFAAANGARDIGLIGCDFSAGRAQAVQSSQGVPDSRVFAGAAGAFEAMRCALERSGVHAVNHSWTI
ncbi:hypothetical protein ACWPMX_14830 [Tsuneonella sp. HG094]